ncbi:MAG: putative DNA binding domain-containing protein [Anaerolineae bacterium]|nr:putative DNA binding domain-containing protein [Anaerolineae bacterium]MCO5203982.1 putative DNA binding domain-containing protein [Anaerolineae bacterium]
MREKPHQQLIYLPSADADALAECLVALANADGGLIVLGLDDNGKPADEIWDEEAEGALRAAVMQCRPPVVTRWQRIEAPHGDLIGIQIPRSADLHTLADGRVLVREGRENRPITGQALRQLAGNRTVAEYEAETVPGADRDDLSAEIITEYLAKREARGLSNIGSLDQLLFEIGATDRDNNPTVAGTLLFSAKPHIFLPQSGVVFVKFSGTDPRGADGGIGYGRRDEIQGPLHHIVERTWNIIWEEMRVGAHVRGLQREEVPEYPRFAVREAIVNAICHRDYRIKGRRIEVRMYDDRMEIISPGGLPGYMTLDNLVEEHFSRNPRIVGGLYQWGYIEELGLGIDRMIEEMAEAGHPPPSFDATPYSFTVTLRSERERPASPKWAHSMNERQVRALTFVRENGSITNRDYQYLCPSVSAETLRRDLADLVSRGILLKIGSKKGTHYILK